MTGWQDLTRELDRWQAAGRTASIWWRDDDAVKPSPALDRLLALSRRHGAGLALAVIPESCEDSLPSALAAETEGSGAEVSVFQHGIAHANQAPAGEKKTELSAAVDLEQTLDRLRAGRKRLAALFGSRFLTVLVPPWNRIAPEIISRLPACGFTGLSTYKIRAQQQPAPGLLQVNSHLDLLRWRPERGFLGESEALALLISHLEARRTTEDTAAVSEEPTGILTHHLVHDEATWRFLDDLLECLGRHPATKLLAPSEAFFHAEAQDGTAEPARDGPDNDRPDDGTEGAPAAKDPGANGVKPQQPTRKGRA